MKDLANMTDMFLKGAREDQDVVEVGKYKYVKKLSQEVVDAGLEDPRSVGQSKWDSERLVGA